MKKSYLFIPFWILLIINLNVQAQNADFVAENYDKKEYQIPMRDGVKLHTVVYSPKDKGQAYPFVMQRTPYSSGPYGEGKMKTLLGPSEI